MENTLAILTEAKAKLEIMAEMMPKSAYAKDQLAKVNRQIEQVRGMLSR